MVRKSAICFQPMRLFIGVTMVACLGGGIDIRISTHRGAAIFVTLAGVDRCVVVAVVAALARLGHAVAARGHAVGRAVVGVLVGGLAHTVPAVGGEACAGGVALLRGRIIVAVVGPVITLLAGVETAERRCGDEDG